MLPPVSTTATPLAGAVHVPPDGATAVPSRVIRLEGLLRRSRVRGDQSPVGPGQPDAAEKRVVRRLGFGLRLQVPGENNRAAGLESVDRDVEHGSDLHVDGYEALLGRAVGVVVLPQELERRRPSRPCRDRVAYRSRCRE